MFRFCGQSGFTVPRNGGQSGFTVPRNGGQLGFTVPRNGDSRGFLSLIRNKCLMVREFFAFWEKILLFKSNRRNFVLKKLARTNVQISIFFVFKYHNDNC